MSELESIARELEQAATRLRERGIDGDEAAGLVDRCAELAARIGSGLDAEARETEGQERLL